MKKDKLYLINTIFRSENIRSVWNEEEEKCYISVVDVVGILTESSDGRKYWNKLKQRLKEEGNELVSNCHQLKLKASDGKYYLTDVADIEKNLEELVITKSNKIKYEYKDIKQIEE